MKGLSCSGFYLLRKCFKVKRVEFMMRVCLIRVLNILVFGGYFCSSWGCRYF